ncbi:MAG: hypothetical protein ACE5IE_07405 [Dehalococcoidia bacterium]
MPKTDGKEVIKLDNRIDKQIDVLVGALTDPIIVFDPSWADVLPDWLKGEIKMQRLAQLMKGEEGIATDAEALAYVSNVSLSQPIASDWVEIYQYLLTRVMGDKVPEEMRRESLDDYRMGLLKELKEWIYRQRVKARQERRRMERAKAKAEAEARAPKQLTLGL